MTFQEDTEVDVSEDTTNDSDNEIDSTSEGEGETTTESKVERQPETSEQRTARLKRQVEREAKKSGLSVEEYLGIKREEKQEVGDEKYNRLALEVAGYTDKEEQDIILKYAAFEKLDVREAAKSTIAKALIKEHRDKASTPSPSARTGKGGSTSIDTLVARYRAGKKLSPEEFKQVRKKLRG